MFEKKRIYIYIYKLSLFDRDDTKQAKTLIFIVVPQVEYGNLFHFEGPKKERELYIKLYSEHMYMYIYIYIYIYIYMPTLNVWVQIYMSKKNTQNL